MKKRCLCLLMLFITLMTLPGLGEEARYSARANREFHIRVSPDDNARRVQNVQPKTTLEVLEWGEEWSEVRLGRMKGFARTRWLSLLRSLDPMRFPVPGSPIPKGLARVIKPVFVTVEGYSGNNLNAGDVIAVREWDGKQAQIDMLRDQSTLPASVVAFQPFTPWDKAEKGEVIGAFTTYYNQSTGGRLAGNRQKNIELAVSRVNGKVVGAGDRFSFNAQCAPYMKSNGYQMAPNISNDGVGYGGGVCQLSTTLYLAALGLPMMVEGWSLHRERGVNYAPQGFDAAVGSYSDLVLRNLLPYAIRIEALPQAGALTVLVYRN